MERHHPSSRTSTPDRHNAHNQQNTSSNATATPRNHVQTEELPAGAIEVIKGHLYFVPKDAPSDHPSTMSHFVRSVIFTNDPTFIYTSYFADFGPFDLGITYQFCRNLQDAMHEARDHRKYVLFYAGSHEHKKANSAACLMAYLICVLDFSVEHAYRPFIGMSPPFIPFRDAGFCINTCPITVLDIARAWRRAKNLGHFDFRTFNLTEFQNMAKLQNGDMSWIIPGKFIAFSGPLPKKRQLAPGVFSLLPEQYVPLFKDLNVTCIVRFNEKMYDRRVFLNHGIRHVDLFYEDGGNPTDVILSAFLQVCEQEKGAIAVHCKAGLGRTGTNIAAYMIKHYGYTAKEAIAWSRLCRPGCVVGPQQQYISVMENKLKKDGEEYRLRRQIATNTTSINNRKVRRNSEKSQISSKMTSTTMNTSSNDSVNNAEKSAHYKTIHTGLQQIVNNSNNNNSIITDNVKRNMSDLSMRSSENITLTKPATAISTTRKKSIDGLMLPTFSRTEGKLPIPAKMNNNSSNNRLLLASANTTLTNGIAALSTGTTSKLVQSETDDNGDRNNSNTNNNNYNNNKRAFDYPERPRTSDGCQRVTTQTNGDLGMSGTKRKDNISFIIPPNNNSNSNSNNNVSTNGGDWGVSLQSTSVSLTHTASLTIDTSSNKSKSNNSNNACSAHSAVPTSNMNGGHSRLTAQTYASELRFSKAIVTIPSTSSTPTSFDLKRESSSSHNIYTKEAWSEPSTPNNSRNNAVVNNNKNENVAFNGSFATGSNYQMPSISIATANGNKSSSGTPRKSPTYNATVSPHAMPVAPNSALRNR